MMEVIFTANYPSVQVATDRADSLDVPTSALWMQWAEGAQPTTFGMAVIVHFDQHLFDGWRTLDTDRLTRMAEDADLTTWQEEEYDLLLEELWNRRSTIFGGS